jgi:outer membrane protein TolC
MFVNLLYVVTIFFQVTAAEELSIDAYLRNVKDKNPSYKAATFKKAGFAESLRESDLYFTPVLQGRAALDSNAAYPGQPGFTYDEIRTKSYNLGVSQEFAFGMQMKLNYNLFHTKFYNAGFGATPLAFENWNAIPSVDVEIPLWQNLFARSSRALRDVSFAQNRAEYEAANLAQTEILINAQLAYWRLATAQAVVGLQKEAFARSKDLYDFIQKKAKMDLRDKSDVLQTKAAYVANELDLKLALDEERSAQRGFNRWLFVAPEEPVPQLKPIDLESFDRTALPAQRPGERLDVSIAQAQSKLSKASAIMAEERNKPSLSLVGSYALNGRNDIRSMDAVSNTGSSGRNSYAYGVQFSVPLHLAASADARDGARMRQAAADAELEHKQKDQDLQWADLVANHQESLNRLDLLGQIVKAQSEKLKEEKRLIRLGRSSLFNVLNFEQDYLRAERARAQSLYESLSLRLQGQLYTGGAK